MKIKKEKNYKKYWNIIILILVAAGIGYLMGYFSGAIMENTFGIYINIDSIFMLIINIVLALILFIIAYLIHIIIHEAGHLIFGLISGYKFVSFRVGSLTLIRDDEGLKFKKYNIPGTGGQCLMMPPEKKNGDYPFILFNLGGAITNILVSILTTILAINIVDNFYLKLILIILSMGGFFAGLTNGIPLKIGGIANDAHNIMTMIRDRDSKESFYKQLRVNGLQSQGLRIKDMPEEDFILREDMNYKNPLNFSRIFLNHNYHLDSMNFQEAAQALEFGDKYFYETIALYQMELNGEKLFLELIGDRDKETIEGLYDKNLRKYIKAAKFMLSKKRIMMAYHALYRENKERALEYHRELKSLAEKYPVKAEADMELMLGRYILEKMEL